MVSYEVAMGLAAVSVLLLAGNVSLDEIIQKQVLGGWYILPLLLGFFIFLVSAFAETNRLPFDLPEAESELIAGYHTEYSAMKFSMFFIAEYSNMVTASALTVTLFFGGWSVPFLNGVNMAPWAWWKTLITLAFFMLKVGFFLFLFMWVRWTLPRFRYDQLMGLGWKVMIPLALVYMVIMAAALLVLSVLGISPNAVWLGFLPAWWAILGALNIVLAVLVFVFLDRGRIVSPASSRIDTAELARLRAVSVPRRLAGAQGD
jgi:NADH-quinone oxidoreductase subunit H